MNQDQLNTFFEAAMQIVIHADHTREINEYSIYEDTTLEVIHEGDDINITNSYEYVGESMIKGLHTFRIVNESRQIHIETPQDLAAYILIRMIG